MVWRHRTRKRQLYSFKRFAVECGINRTLLRSLTTAGKVRITAKADGLKPAEISLSSLPVEMKDGLSKYIPGNKLEGWLTRGETHSHLLTKIPR